MHDLVVPNVSVERRRAFGGDASGEEVAGCSVLALLLKDVDTDDCRASRHRRRWVLEELTLDQGGLQDLEASLEDDLLLIVFQDAQKALKRRYRSLEVEVKAEALQDFFFKLYEVLLMHMTLLLG